MARVSDQETQDEPGPVRNKAAHRFRHGGVGREVQQRVHATAPTRKYAPRTLAVSSRRHRAVAGVRSSSSAPTRTPFSIGRLRVALARPPATQAKSGIRAGRSVAKNVLRHAIADGRTDPVRCSRLTTCVDLSDRDEIPLDINRNY